MYLAKNQNILIVADSIGKYYALDINSGKLLWEQKNTSPYNSQIKIYKGMFFITDYENTLRAYSIKNGGVFKHRSETSETVSKNEVDYLVDKAREFMEYYSRRFIDFMSFNQSDYPEYTSNTNDDIYPDYDALFNGWVL